MAFGLNQFKAIKTFAQFITHACISLSVVPPWRIYSPEWSLKMC
jgi:hypothetical protein